MHKKISGILLLSLALLSLSCGSNKAVTKAGIGASQDWMGTYVGNQKVGYFYSREEVKDGNYRFTQKSVLSIEMMGTSEKIDFNLVVVTDSFLDLASFEFDVDSRQRSFFARGRREGDKLSITVESAGRKETRQIAARGPLLTSPVLGHWVTAQNLEPDEKVTVTLFEPLLLKTVPVTIKEAGRETVMLADGGKVLTRKYEVRMLGLETLTWLDSTGVSVKEFQKPAITMIREPREKALADISAAQQLDLLSYFAITPDKPLPNPRALNKLKLRILGEVDTDSLELSSSTQSYEKIPGGYEILIDVPDRKNLPSSTIPMSEPKQYLESSFYIQTEDPQIKSTARQIVGSETDGVRAAEKLVKWVYANLAKRATASAPSAVEVLATREGDCNEHAILLAALGRAAGIPTRINVGVVYLDGAFFYHAWNSFFLGGEWIPADATFNQFPADATHLQFNQGELDEQARVLSLVGQIEIEIISHE